MSNATNSLSRLKLQAQRYLAIACCSLIATTSFAQQGTGNSVMRHLIPATNIGVKAEFTAQTFTNVPDNGTGTGIQFGAGQNIGAVLPTAYPIWVPLTQASGTEESLFTGLENGSVGEGSSYSLFTATRPLALAGVPTDSRQLMGQLKLRFDQAVENPVVHLAGLGGAAAGLGFSTELELVDKGLELQRLSGNQNLSVQGLQILNTASFTDASAASGAASGSVQVRGAATSELTFSVYMRGNGQGGVWEQTGNCIGDRWQIGVSLPQSKAATALPVYISNFLVNQETDCAATLRWKTATELGISSMDVEHSTDGITFTKLTTFESDGSAESKNYRYAMDNAPSGRNFFRIRINNNLEQTGYSPIRPINIHCSSPEVSVQPNPSSGILHVRGMEAGSTIVIYNMSGREVMSTRFQEPETVMDISDLHEGIYMLISRDAKGNERSRTRIQKL